MHEHLDATANAAGGSASNVLTGLRVLFVPKNSRTAYFQEFLRAARQAHDWHIDVVAPARHASVWNGIADRVIATPDFARAQPWENDRSACEELDRFVRSCERATGISAGRVILAGERDLGRGFSWTNFYWFHDETARRGLKDNLEPMRILRRLFSFARESLETSKPDLVVGGEWASPLCYAFNQ